MLFDRQVQTLQSLDANPGILGVARPWRRLVMGTDAKFRSREATSFLLFTTRHTSVILAVSLTGKQP